MLITKRTLKEMNGFCIERFKAETLGRSQHVELFYWRLPFDIDLYNNYECGETELKQAVMLEF